MASFLTTASAAGLVLLHVVGHFTIVPIHIQVILTSFFTIYVGAQRSLAVVEESGAEYELVLDADAPGKITRRTGQEAMAEKDAWWFPVLGGCTLTSLYLAFMFFPKEYVNMLITGYIFVLGVVAVTYTFLPGIQRAIGAEGDERLIRWRLPYHRLPLPASWVGTAAQTLEFMPSEFAAFVFACAVGGWYLATKHWCANNLLGIAFSIQGIEQLSIGSVRTGTVLLSLLFFYDIFFVFGTPIMVGVARNVDAPIKLVFPKAFAVDDADAQFSMLGLGDIVVPGLFIALLLRFDASKATYERMCRRHEGGRGGGASTIASKAPDDFPQVYFNVTMVGYVLGMIATLVVMYHFHAAQPALLYLVPAVLGSAFLAAALKNEVQQMFQYTEESDQDDEGEEGDEGDDEGDDEGEDHEKKE